MYLRLMSNDIRMECGQNVALYSEMSTNAVFGCHICWARNETKR